MVEDDIYGNKKRYKKFKNNLEDFAEKPKESSQRIYYCKNEDNLKYFRRLFTKCEVKDHSYIHRMKLIAALKLITWVAEKDLENLERDDIEKIVAKSNQRYDSPKSKENFRKSLKLIWKMLFPAKDEKGRPDERITPYVVRHIETTVEDSKKKAREDKITWKEYQQIVDYFSDDKRMQAYITLAVESLGRPQEILYRTIGDIEMHENYAKIWITDHGKEGPNGFLQCVDSFPYLARWLEKHPFKNDEDSHIFIRLDNAGKGEQLTPKSINVKLREACRELEIDKPVTAYSLKRNGVTFRRLRGDSDVEIQHAARWSSTEQLQTYDLSSQEDALKKQLSKRGITPEATEGFEEIDTEQQKCSYCDEICGASDNICSNCKRPLDKSKIRKDIKEEDENVDEMKKKMNNLQEKLKILEEQVMNDAVEHIKEKT